MYARHDPAAVGPAEATDRTPGVVTDWLRRSRSGGVHVFDRGGRTFTPWHEVLDHVATVADGLRARGAGPGMRIGIRGHNCLEWLVLDLALLRLGAVPVAVPVPDFKGRTNAELSGLYGLSAMFAAKQGRGPSDDETVAVLEELLSEPMSLPLLEPAPRARGERIPAGDDGDVFTLAFSSGTAGRVKCLLLGWPGVAALIEAHSTAYPLQPGDRIMIALPLSTFQQRYLSYLAIRNDCDIVLTTASYFVQALPATRPTFLLGPPNFYEFVENRYRNMSRLRRAGLEAAAWPAVLLPGAALRRRWRRLVFRSLHAMYGGAMRLMLVGSAPIRDSMLEFFAKKGFELYQIYGMTEIGYLTWNRRAANRMGSVGREVYPGTVTLAEDGEILVRHDWHLCIGYEGEPADSVAQVFRGENTIATGDIGSFDDDGFLHLRGRKKNLIITSGGHKLQLEDLEDELGNAQGVTQVCLYPLPDSAGMAAVCWYEGSEEVVRKAVRQRVGQVNTKLGPAHAVRGLVLLPGPLDPGSPLLNRNLKVNREAVRVATDGQLESLI